MPFSARTCTSYSVEASSPVASWVVPVASTPASLFQSPGWSPGMVASVSFTRQRTL